MLYFKTNACAPSAACGDPALIQTGKVILELLWEEAIKRRRIRQSLQKSTGARQKTLPT
jgi:hypothetical protein